MMSSLAAPPPTPALVLSRTPELARCSSSPPPALRSDDAAEFGVQSAECGVEMRSSLPFRIPHSAFRIFRLMRILRTYILREHAAPFLVTLGGLTAVLLVGNIIKFAELVVAKGVSVVDIVRLILYLLPYMLGFTIPMACLVAMTLAFGRLSTDYELIAMRASGVAPIRLAFPILAVGFVISLLVLIVNDRLVPSAHLAFRRQLKAIGIKQPAAYLEG